MMASICAPRVNRMEMTVAAMIATYGTRLMVVTFTRCLEPGSTESRAMDQPRRETAARLMSPQAKMAMNTRTMKSEDTTFPKCASTIASSGVGDAWISWTFGMAN